MALNKQPVNISFNQGLDTKTDPWQVSVGKFLELENSIFTKGGLLQKRNGFQSLPSLPDASYTQIKTFNGNLTAIGTSIAAFAEGQMSWSKKGTIQPVELDVLPLVRSSTNQTQCDAVISNTNLVCTVYTDNNGSSNSYKYVISDAITGQNIVNPTLITPTAGVVTGSPRVFLTSRYFIVVFNTVISTVNTLEYVAISLTNVNTVTTASVISTAYDPLGNPAFDGVAMGDFLFLAWNGSDGGGAIRLAYLNNSLTISPVVVYSGHTASLLSLSVDLTVSTPVIYVSFYSSGSSTGYVLATNNNLSPVLAPTQFIASGTVDNLTSVAKDQILTVYYEVDNNYSYDSSIPTHYIKKNTITQSGTVGTASVLVRSVGLASKAFLFNGSPYLLSTYYSLFQPTYFLLNGAGQVIAKIAYQNAGGYLTTGLPSALITNTGVSIAYLFKDLISSVNKTQGVTSAAGVYSQTGVNLVTFILQNPNLYTTELGSNLNLSGGLLFSYDGQVPVEQNFNLYPDNIEVSTTGSGGFITAQQYFYQVVYEWTDGQGNIFRSAPSIPVSITTTGSTSSNTVNIPSLRLTYKIANPVKITVYRWSTAQQEYFEVTSIASPLLNPNVLTTDSVAFVDTLADSSIIGNALIYTTGGVIEDVGGPSTSVMTAFDNRLFLVDAEDKNLLWYSKQVIENTPVEMSDLFTIFVSPTISAQGSTGPITALSAMDDKLIIFKKDAIYYMNGTGPDNTGSNSQFSQPTYISSTVGCTNQNSIVITPVGIMFQSDKGIWLLSRDLSTQYIGAAVEAFNSSEVLSALTIPGTNQVRFTLDSGVTLMFDYYYTQWGTFKGIPGLSSVLYQDLHTFINKFGQVLQEKNGFYLDGTNPVLLSFTTSWLDLAGLQGYQRAYWFYLIGTYYSPHKLVIQIAYDYAPQATQQSIITPDNFNYAYGVDTPFGSGSPYGGQPTLEQWQVFLQRQLCESFQISVSEIFDSTFLQPSGVGLTLSGLNIIVGTKKGYRPTPAKESVG